MAVRANADRILLQSGRSVSSLSTLSPTVSVDAEGCLSSSARVSDPLTVPPLRLIVF